VKQSAFAACVVALIIVSVTGCDTDDPPPPPAGNGNSSATSAPPGTSTSASAAALPHSGAPKVSDPLPASVFTGDPCTDALTPDQVKQALGVDTPGRPGQSVVGPKCEWNNQANSSSATVYYDTTTNEGLSSSYRGIKPQATTWRELPLIQGFPAVAAVTPAGGPPDEFCQVYVGLADSVAVYVGVLLSDAKVGKADPCEGAARVADMVVGNLRQKAGA
jgi:hypothetical protein